MLVLARKPNQTVMIGDEIEVKVIEIKGDQVKLGFVAPRNVKVYRAEIYEDVKRSNEEASRSRAIDIKSAGSILKRLQNRKSTEKPES